MARLMKRSILRNLQSAIYGQKQPLSSASYFLAKSISRIEDDKSTRLLKVQWENGKENLYPYLFLRDHCQCPECFHPFTKSRKLDTVAAVDLGITIDDFAYDASDDVVEVTWPDGHQSRFTAKWLKSRFLSRKGEQINDRTGLDSVQRVSWTSMEIRENTPFVDFHEIESDEKALKGHLENLLRYGLSIVRNAPLELSVLQKMADLMCLSIVRHTNYGPFFTVESKPSPSNLAYTGSALPMHTDLPFYDYQPGVQLLHCIRQSSGGESDGASLLVDGMKVVEDLKENSPEDYHLLTTTNFRFNDEGTDFYGEFDLRFERPIIELDKNGKFVHIAYNNPVRDFINAPAENIQRIYEAYYKLSAMLRDKHYQFQYKMAPGDMLVFDNNRVLHGRMAFDATSSDRKLHGSFLDWDDIRSTWRVLHNR
eukprot:TCONS_00057317-protein